MPLLCCDVGLVSEFCLTAGCVLMGLASPAASQAAVYANGLIPTHQLALTMLLSIPTQNESFGSGNGRKEGQNIPLHGSPPM